MHHVSFGTCEVLNCFAADSLKFKCMSVGVCVCLCVVPLCVSNSSVFNEISHFLYFFLSRFHFLPAHRGEEFIYTLFFFPFSSRHSAVHKLLFSPFSEKRNVLQQVIVIRFQISLG